MLRAKFHFSIFRLRKLLFQLSDMKLFAIACIALIAAVHAAPQAKVFTDAAYPNIAAARLSAGDIAKAGAGLDQLETQLKAFSDAALAKTISAAEKLVEDVATPYVEGIS